MGPTDEAAALHRALAGRWEKITQTDATAMYPDQLEFADRGSYQGKNDVKSRHHPVWDVGRFHVVGPGRIRLTTANDAEVIYPVRVAEDTLTVVTPRDGEIRYRRVK